MSAMDPKTYYKDVMSKRDYAYYDSFTPDDQRTVIEETRRRLHQSNLKRMKECVVGDKTMTLLGIASHELRTPLNAVIGIIDLMQADVMTEDQRLYVRSLEQSCTYLYSVVSRLQDLAALLHGQSTLYCVSFDLVAIITGVAESMQHFSEKEGKGTQVALHLDPKIPLSVFGDLTKVQQVITNLVTIAANSSTEKRASVKADLLEDGPIAHIKITVESFHNNTPAGLLDGIGLDFSPEELFKPTSYNNMYQGLVISREFLHMIGSDLETSWDDNKSLGFSFHLRLPSARNSVGGAGPDNQSNLGDLVSDIKSVKILLVEDNDVNLRIAETMLNRMGFAVDTATNGLEAVSALHLTTYNIVLMDCDMPLCNGYDATKHIRTKMGNTTVIIIALTANSTNAAKDKCIASGMNDYFTKPITMKTLSEMLHKWLPTTLNMTGERGASRCS